MDAQTIAILQDVNDAFYRERAASFDATRRDPWPGWARCLEMVGVPPAEPRVLDVGCGNLRFERYLAARDAWRDASVVAIDACESLVHRGDGELPPTRLVVADALDLLACTNPLGELGENPFDLVVCFGLMHHVPGRELRRQLLGGMLAAARPGGAACVSLWQFARDERLGAKARADHARLLPRLADVQSLDPAQLDPGDYLLGWQGDQNAVRYCHSFDDADVADLVGHAASCGAHLVDDFASDGRPGNLNRYLVFTA